jgi:abhydrolase domain-containing protein 17
VVAYDYPGYGRSSPINATDGNVQEAALAVLHFCLENIPHKVLILYGRSIGSVPTLYLASELHMKQKLLPQFQQKFGVFLHSPLASAIRVCSISSYLPEYVLKKCDCCFLNNMETCKAISCPVAIMHGKQDAIVPVRNAQYLWDSLPVHAKFEKLLLVGSLSFPATHNNLMLMYGTEHMDFLHALISKISSELHLKNV